MVDVNTHTISLAHTYTHTHAYARTQTHTHTVGHTFFMCVHGRFWDERKKVRGNQKQTNETK